MIHTTCVFYKIILKKVWVNKFLGVDIGGTNTKIGIVTRNGELLEKVKYPTNDLFSGDGYIKNFSAILETLEKEKNNNTIKGDLIKSSFITSTMGVSYKLKLEKNI